MIYQFIEQHRHEFPIELMCRTPGVGVSGYFAWWGRPENRYVQADGFLFELGSVLVFAGSHVSLHCPSD